MGKAFVRQNYCARGEMFQLIYFSLVKIGLEMLTGKDFAADYAASWRADWTRNYNACPDLED